MSGCGTWQEVGPQAKGRSGRESSAAGFYVWPPLHFTYTYDILGLSPPLPVYNPWPLSQGNSSSHLSKGLAPGTPPDRTHPRAYTGPSGLAPERPRNGVTAAGCPHANLPAPMSALTDGPELLGRKLGVFYVNSLSTQSAGSVHWAQLCPGRGGEYPMVSVPGLRRERPGPQRLPNEGRQQLE